MRFCNTLIRLRPASAAMLVAMLALPALAFAQAPGASAPPAAAGPGAPPAAAAPAVPPAPNAPAAQAPVTSAPATTPAPAPEITLKLPRDLSPWGIFLAADIVVKAVMIGLVFASLLTWTIWFAKVIELIAARRRLRATITMLSEARSLADCIARLPNGDEAAGAVIRAAETELRLSADALDPVGVKERIVSRLERIEAAAGRRMIRGTGILATVGATAPFVGLFGTVWGIMNSFIGISKSHTTNLAVVAPGIAEALLATALGLVAAIPAVVMYNVFSRWIASFRALQADAAAEVLRLVSRDLDRGAMRPVERRRPMPVAEQTPMSVRLDHGEDGLTEVHEINVTPFIDVILVLLIIFMIAAPLATVDISVDLPTSNAEQQPRLDKPLILTLKSDLSLMLNNDPVSRPALAASLTQATGGDKQQRVFLRADKAVSYGELMALMNELRTAGYLHVALVGLETDKSQ